jgi:thymidine phosphorylase
LLFISGNASSPEEGQQKLKETLTNGQAAQKFQQMIIAQGADPEKANALCVKGGDVWKVLPRAKFITPIKSKQSGDSSFFTRMNMNNF